jgi:peptidoglycan/xylan/chitin deacetylase (PgdA/CDA1 family)
MVLTFHDVRPNPDGDYVIAPTDFDADMAALHAARVHTIDAESLVGYVDGKVQRLPPRAALLTFDDGTSGDWIYTDPILAHYGFHAVCFTVTSYVGKRQPYYLTWAELKRMYDTGRWDIESHTHAGHHSVPIGPAGFAGAVGAFMTNREWLPSHHELESEGQWRRRVSSDLETSIAEIEKHGFPRPRLFAFPFSATRTPNNDPAIPAILGRMTKSLFALSMEDDSTPEPVLPGSRSQFVRRLEVFRTTTPGQLLAAYRRAVT